MKQDKSRFEEQRKDLEKDGAIRYEMKNVEGEPRKSIREAIAEQSNDQPQDKEFLDKKKAAYLFDADEISVIEKDLKEQDKNPYGYDEEYEKLHPEYREFLENNQDKLEKVLEEGYDNEKLVSSSITFENVKDSSVRKLKIVENTDNAIKDKIAKQITGITSELANQKGLSKIWAIKEKFGIDEDKDLTEEKAFHRESQKVDDTYYKSQRIFKEGYKYTIPISCPLCKGNKLLNLLIFKIKCPKCHGIGSIQADPEKYILRLKEESSKNQEVKKKKVRTLIFDDQKIVNF